MGHETYLVEMSCVYYDFLGSKRQTFKKGFMQFNYVNSMQEN